MEAYYVLALNNAIDIFNANRHWILPFAMAGVVAMLAGSIWICAKKE